MPSPRGEKEFVPLECSQSGCGFSPIALGSLLHKARPHDCRQGGMLLNGGDAYPPVLLQFVPGALKFHTCVGRESPADPIIRRGKSFAVLALFDLNCSFQILTA